MAKESPWPKRICRFKDCKNRKREGHATCPEHAEYEQQVLRECYGLAGLP